MAFFNIIYVCNTSPKISQALVNFVNYQIYPSTNKNLENFSVLFFWFIKLGNLQNEVIKDKDQKDGLAVDSYKTTFLPFFIIDFQIANLSVNILNYYNKNLLGFATTTNIFCGAYDDSTFLPELIQNIIHTELGKMIDNQGDFFKLEQAVDRSFLGLKTANKHFGFGVTSKQIIEGSKTDKAQDPGAMAWVQNKHFVLFGLLEANTISEEDYRLSGTLYLLLKDSFLLGFQEWSKDKQTSDLSDKNLLDFMLISINLVNAINLWKRVLNSKQTKIYLSFSGFRGKDYQIGFIIRIGAFRLEIIKTPNGWSINIAIVVMLDATEYIKQNHIIRSN